MSGGYYSTCGPCAILRRGGQPTDACRDLPCVGRRGRLRVEDVAPPAPAADEVLIDVRATAVNYADSIMVAGRYQTRPSFPFSPGLETAGIVAACGAAVTRFRRW